MYRLKRKWFSGVKNMTLVTPSQWLAEQVKESYLKDYPVRVIYNGINLAVFKPTASNFRARFGLSDEKYVVLGVAFDWGLKKGLDVFVELSKRLDNDRFSIVLVGTDDELDKSLPRNIVSIHRTKNQKELAEIYSASDVFVNPTREEVLGMVNLEALACGIPVITFNSGGSPECIDSSCGCVVPCNDIDGMEKGIVEICSSKTYLSSDCIKRASGFDKDLKDLEYLDLLLGR
jgi:glycosyltransferase involved in cell wall biosynthesis